MTERLLIRKRRPIPKMTELRRHRRVDVSLSARFLSPQALQADQQAALAAPDEALEVSGVVTNLSAGGLYVQTPSPLPEGTRTVIYVDDVGRLEIEIVRASEHGFAARIEGGRNKRERLIEKLTWVHNRVKLKMDETRRHPRQARGYAATLVTPDGQSFECTVLDMSLSGAGIGIQEKPEIGTVVKIGKITGRVVRHFERGVGIEFVRNA